MQTNTMVQKKNIYFARHGERMDVLNKQWIKDARRPFDPPLSDYGFEQAHELGVYAAQIQPRITHIYASPLLRTMQTAIQVAKEINQNVLSTNELIKIRVEPGFGEFYTVEFAWDKDNIFRTADELNEISKDIRYIDQDYKAMFDSDYFLQAKTETRHQLHERLKRILKHILDTHTSDCNILIITHAATLIEGVRELLTITQQRSEKMVKKEEIVTEQRWDKSPIRAGVCSLTHVELADDKWTVQKNGLVSFLSRGEQYFFCFVEDKDLYKPS